MPSRGSAAISASAGSAAPFDEGAAAREAWLAAFATLYCAREQCPLEHGRHAATLVYPAMGMMDALSAVTMLRADGELADAVRARCAQSGAPDTLVP